MDIDSISKRVKDAASDTKVFDILGRRIYPNDVVIGPKQFGRGVCIGIVEKFTPKGVKVMKDARVYKSDELLVLPSDEDGINSIISEQRKLLDEYKKRPKQKRVVTLYRDFIFLKKDKLNGEKWLCKSILSYLSGDSLETKKANVMRYLDTSKNNYLFLCRTSKGDFYFSKSLDDLYIARNVCMKDSRYVPKEEVDKRAWDIHAFKMKLMNKDAHGYMQSPSTATYPFKIDENFIFEQDEGYYSSKKVLVYPLVIDGCEPFGMAFDNYCMPIFGILSSFLKDPKADMAQYREYEKTFVELIKKGLEEI